MKNLIFAGIILTVAGLLFSMVTYAKKNTPPSTAIKFPFSIGELGKQLADNGTIDPAKFPSQFLASQKKNFAITDQNAQKVLNFLWAFGLANKNEILEKGPMMDPRYGGAQNFASTGGWTLGVGNPMDHYSHHQMVMLDPDQQDLVNRVAKTIYRPCCKNPAYFPDCNHGMAMLGLMELMAKNGMNEQQMHQAADAVNAKWFPGYGAGGSCTARIGLDRFAIINMWDSGQSRGGDLE